MKVDVVWLPEELNPSHLHARSVAVFDVLRATTTITAALAAGVREIHIFRSIDDAKNAAAAFSHPVLLCGEQNCLPPSGFDLGNSPGQFRADEHRGKIVCMATTNGTRALAAASSVDWVIPAGLVNATSVADVIMSQDRDVTLLCAGTNGQVAMEDVIGTGAVLSHLAIKCARLTLESDAARMAILLFNSVRSNLEKALTETTGGKNVRDAGLPQDITFAAKLDSIKTVGKLNRQGQRMWITPIAPERFPP